MRAAPPHPQPASLRPLDLAPITPTANTSLAAFQPSGYYRRYRICVSLHVWPVSGQSGAGKRSTGFRLVSDQVSPRGAEVR